MNHSPAQVLAQLLIDGSIGVAVPDVQTTKPDWAIYTNYLPDSEHESDQILCIFDTAGLIDGRDQRSKQSIDHPGWQVRVRSLGFQVGWAKISAVSQFLDSVARQSVTVDSSVYTVQGVHRTSPIIPLSPSENDRKRRDAFTLNGMCTISQLS